MNAISTILERLPGLKSSEDFAGAIDTLETEHRSAVDVVAELEAGREAAIFSGGDLVALEGDIAAAEGRAKTLAVALSGAEKRRDEAAEAERQAALEAVATGAGKNNKTLRSRLIDFARVAEELAGHAETIKGLRAEILTANNVVREGGRGDLVTMDPIKREARETDRQITDPLAGLVIAGHWPTSRPFLLAKAG